MKAANILFYLFIFRYSFSHDFRTKNDIFFIFTASSHNQNFCVNKSMTIFLFLFRNRHCVVWSLGAIIGVNHRRWCLSIDCNPQNNPGRVFCLVIKYAHIVFFSILLYIFVTSKFMVGPNTPDWLVLI